MFIKASVAGVIFTGITFPAFAVVAEQICCEVAPMLNKKSLINSVLPSAEKQIAQASSPPNSPWPNPQPSSPPNSPWPQSSSPPREKDTSRAPSMTTSQESKSQAILAVELLKAAFASAVPPTMHKDGTQTSWRLATHTFVGNVQQFAVNTTESLDVQNMLSNAVTQTPISRSIQANYSQLKDVKIIDGSTIVVACDFNLSCFSYDNPRLGAGTAFEAKLKLADSETAENAKVAIQLLIQANKLFQRPAP